MRGLDADSVLGGRYRLTAPVAEGGMGEVWKALDELLDRIVAVKVLKPEFAADAGFLDRFRTEARNSARLSHPNIATLYDYGEDEGRAYLVMELVPGAPLSDLIAADAPLDVAVAAAITAQTARGLAAAHRAGLVHRDVKPGNLLVTPDGNVKITDFGISRATSQSPVTATGEVMGTASYLAPEQAIGRRDIGPATDLYALGVVLHEMLSGARPFTGDSQVAIALAQVNQPPPPLPASVSDAADALVAALLVKEPERRPSDAAGVAAVADRLAAGDDAGALTRLRGIVPAAAAGAAGAAGATAASTTVMPAGESTTRAMPAAVGGGVDPTAVVAASPATTGTPLRGAGVGDREPAGGGGGRPPRRLTTPLIGLIVVLAIILLAAVIGIVNGLGDADGPVTDPATDTTTSTSTDAPQDEPEPSEGTPTTTPPPPPPAPAPTTSSTTSEAPPPSDEEDAPGGETRPTEPAPVTTTPATPAPTKTKTVTPPPPAEPPADPDPPPAEPGSEAPGGAAAGAGGTG